MNHIVDEYFTVGCGRCPLGNTPECKVNKWKDELRLLRALVLECGLSEESKWGFPCYTLQTENILLLGAFKEYCALSFFKGVLLDDPAGILSKPGENSQAVRLIRFGNVREITGQAALLKTYIYAAIEVEKAGLKVAFKKTQDPIPEEFRHKLDENPALQIAFDALTPGRQRGYLLYFSAPKQPQTRQNRIEKCMQQILDGKGLHD